MHRPCFDVFEKVPELYRGQKTTFVDGCLNVDYRGVILADDANPSLAYSIHDSQEDNNVGSYDSMIAKMRRSITTAFRKLEQQQAERACVITSKDIKMPLPPPKKKPQDPVVQEGEVKTSTLVTKNSDFVALVDTVNSYSKQELVKLCQEIKIDLPNFKGGENWDEYDEDEGDNEDQEEDQDSECDDLPQTTVKTRHFLENGDEVEFSNDEKEEEEEEEHRMRDKDSEEEEEEEDDGGEENDHNDYSMYQHEEPNELSNDEDDDFDMYAD